MPNEPWEPKEVVPESLAAWQVNHTLLAYGPCPHCGDQADEQLHGGGTVVVASVQPADLDAPAVFTCNCTGGHAGRPAGLQGCGALWVARVKKVGAHFEFSPESDAGLRKAAVVVAKATEDAHATVTAAADKWVPGVAALLGLSGVATAVVARDAVSALSTCWRVSAFALVCLAVLGAAIATVLVYRAAYGWPTSVSLTSAAKVLEAARKLQERASKAASHLKISVSVALAAVIALLAALGIIWLQPNAGTKPTAQIDFTAPGATGVSHRCAEIVSIIEGVVKIKVITGGPVETVSIPMSSVSKLQSAPCKGK